MTNKTPSKYAHKPNTQGAKQLIFILSVSATLGFWALFSNKNKLDLIASVSNDQSAGDTPPTQADNQFVLDLPPMPTLIPQQNSSRLSLELPSIPSQDQASLSQPAVPLLGKIFMGGSKPQSKVVMVPAPVTRTRSSK
jgi:hypothetical protein